MRSILACAFLIVGVALGEDPPAPVSTTAAAVPAPGVTTPTPGVSTTVPPAVLENVKLSSKGWLHYKGCDDTCLSLCLENPTSFDSKCSVLFSNNTMTVHPTSESCTKPKVGIHKTS